MLLKLFNKIILQILFQNILLVFENKVFEYLSLVVFKPKNKKLSLYSNIFKNILYNTASLPTEVIWRIDKKCHLIQALNISYYSKLYVYFASYGGKLGILCFSLQCFVVSITFRQVKVVKKLFVFPCK